MNVRTLCLAILYFGDSTGYEIKKLSMEGKYSHFVDASFGSIYPALSRLEKDGMVTCREENQHGKPPRKIYSITDAGRDEFVGALFEKPNPDIFRSEFLLIAMCADLVGPEKIRAAIDHRLVQLEEEIANISRALEGAESPGTRWVCGYGLACMRASIEHLQKHRGELESIAETGSAHQMAAE